MQVWRIASGHWRESATCWTEPFAAPRCRLNQERLKRKNSLSIRKNRRSQSTNSTESGRALSAHSVGEKSRFHSLARILANKRRKLVLRPGCNSYGSFDGLRLIPYCIGNVQS